MLSTSSCLRLSLDCQPRQSVMPPAFPPARTAPPSRRYLTTSSSSAGWSWRLGPISTRSAGRWSGSRVRLKSAVRRHSTGWPKRTSTSYSALLPPGPARKVDGRVNGSSFAGGLGLRTPANTARLTATASSRASQSSTRENMLQHQLRVDAEVAVARRVARRRAEHMAVELGDEPGQRGAPRRVERRLTRILGGRLGRMKMKGPRPVEFQNDRGEAVGQRLSEAAGAGQLLGAPQVSAGVLKPQSGSDRRWPVVPDGRTVDAPSQVPEVHQDGEEHDHGDPQQQLKNRVVRLVHPVEPG